MGEVHSGLRHDGVPTLPAEAVLDQLSRVLSSPDFDVPERARKFLKYVVEETLEGRADRIKAFAIAVEVFGRDATFDGQNDPIVRIEATRIRRALERYYLTAGATDPVKIDMPKGAYVPVFTYRDCVAPTAATNEHEGHSNGAARPLAKRGRWAWRSWAPVAAICVALALALAASLWPLKPTPSRPAPPRLLVATFDALDDRPEIRVYAAGLTDELITELSRFGDMVVLGPETSRAAGPSPAADAVAERYGAGLLLSGSVRSAEGRISVTARLVDAANRQVLWSNSYKAELNTRNLLDVQSDIAEQVAAAIARPYGVVFQTEAKRIMSAPPDKLEPYLCVLSYYMFRANPTAKGHADARACLQNAVERFPSYAMAWAMLSYAYLDEYRWGFNPSSPGVQPIDRALNAARTALRLEPDSSRVLQALMMALFFSRDVPAAMAAGERALALNPNDAEIMGEFGTRVGFTGDWARSIRLLERAFAANPAHSNYYRVNLAFSAYMNGDVERALREIRIANLDSLPMYYLLAAIIYAEGGLSTEAKASRDRFMSIRPTFFGSLETELDRRNFLPADRARFVAGLQKAGFPVPKASGL